MAEKLTPQQAQAVRDRGGKLLVSAAAGSGKTKVLVDRLMMYLTDPVAPANIDEFLIITYTKAAAAELRGKIAAKLTERIAEGSGSKHLQRQLQRLYLTKISTVHSFCADLLRQYASRMDLSADFRVADENECRELRERALTELLDYAYEFQTEDPAFRAFVDTQGLGRTDALVPELIQKVYDSARCHLQPDVWLRKCLDGAAVEDIADAAQTVWGKYLMQDLFITLDGHILALEACQKELHSTDGMEKPAALIADTVYQLKHLRDSKTWDEIVTRQNIDYGRLTFPRKCSAPELADRVKAIRGACKAALDKKFKAFSDPSAQVLADLEESHSAMEGLVTLVRDFGLRYEKLKKQRRILDFGDLEHRTLDLLLGKSRSGPTQAARETGRIFREIMVDEYQDSNGVQDAIFEALTREKQNLFMVGDVKQSIYQFRLADPTIFLEKYHAYIPAEEAQTGQGRKVLLSSNFRSGGGVLAAANDVFRACMTDRVGGLYYTDDEALREGIPHIDIGEAETELHVVQIREHTYPEEAAYVANRIKTLLDGSHYVRQGDQLRPIRAEDVVILLRSPGSVGRYYQQALESLGIRCTSGGGKDLLQTGEIQTLRAILQVISNPRQDIPLIAVLSSPVFGFIADDLAMIRAGNKRFTFYDSLSNSKLEKVISFRQTLHDLRQEAKVHSLTRLLEELLQRTRLDSIFSSMPDGEEKHENIRAFYQYVSNFEASTRRDLSQFLEHLDLLEEKGLPVSSEQSTDSVTIMSIHKSKGLEFPVVILGGLSREFNRESLRSQVLCDRDLGLGLSCVDTKYRIRYPGISKRAIAVKSTCDSISEELRVLYVAMTRARDRLIMIYSAKKPEADLADLVQRMDLTPGDTLNSAVVCPGEWVLYAALQRTEAGALHAIGGRPKQTLLLSHPWFITVGESPQSCSAVAVEESKEMIDPEMIQRIRDSLAFRYGYMDATTTPSKVTATSLKGRDKDQEAMENTQPPKPVRRSWRKPGFGVTQKGGKDYGNAIHAVMQFIRYEACNDRSGIDAEIQRLASEGFITQDQAQAVDREQVYTFFQTEIGKRLCKGENVLREFKFSILDDAGQYQNGPAGEKLLLQGVVDCALMDEDGITVIDFKSDRIRQEDLLTSAENYAPQVRAYAHALARIFEKEVKSSYLYYFHIGEFAKV